MKNKQRFPLFGIGAIFLTQIAYLIDSDQPYDDIKLTIMEFSIISLFFFGLFSFSPAGTALHGRRGMCKAYRYPTLGSQIHPIPSEGYSAMMHPPPSCPL